MNKILFPVDEPDGLRTRARWLRYLDELRVMGKLEGEARLGITHAFGGPALAFYRGHPFQTLPVYLLTEDDYRRHVLPHGWVNKPDQVLVIHPTLQMVALPPDLVGSGPSPQWPAAWLAFGGHVAPDTDDRGAGWLYFDDTRTYHRAVRP